MPWKSMAHLCLLCLTMAAFAFFAGAGSMHAQAAQTPVDPPVSPGFHKISGIVYTQGKTGDLLADIYEPAATGQSRPGVLMVHGGAWKNGTRTQLEKLAEELAARGYVCVSVDYDVVGTGGVFPVSLREVERALAWMRHHATELGLDPARVAVAGSSAGGELAALLALEQDTTPDLKVQAAIILNGVLDLSNIGTDLGDFVSPYLGGSCTSHEKACRAASPVYQIHPGAPSFYVGHGTADRIVPYSQAQMFADRLRTAGVSVTVFTAPGAGHTYWGMPQWFKVNLTAIAAFLSTNLASKQPVPSAQ